MKQRYILDGSGFIFRAYHGMQSLTDDQGRDIHALYGFVRMMIRLMTERPDYFLICRDSPHMSLRKQTFDAYKAQRPPLDDNFKWQIGQIKQCVNDLKIATRELAGYEADDLIASMIKKHESDPHIHFTIVSGDKDLKQLINEHTSCYDQMKQLKIGVAEFQQDYGFMPTQLIDYLALLGDSSDNIPGVQGIGEKYARSLIQKYGNLEMIYQHIDDIQPQLRQKLLDGKESAYQSRYLIRLYDAPIDKHYDVSYYQLALDYGLMEDILIGHYRMNSLARAIQDLKKNLSMPKQESLFG